MHSVALNREYIQRASWVDVAKGLGIIAVVYGHAARGVNLAGVTMPYAGHVLDFAIYLFHMPLFFLLSGLWVEGSVIKGKRNFVVKKMWIVVVPYVLWTITQASVMMIFSSQVNDSPTFSSLLNIWWKPIAQWWFLYVLMICHLLAAIFAPNWRYMLMLSVVLFLLSPFVQGVWGNFSYSFVFYCLGVWLGSSGFLSRLSDNVSKIGLHILSLTAFCALAIVVLSAAFLYGRIDSPNIPFTVPITLAGIVGAMALALLLRDQKWLVAIGQASMTIYVMHILAASGLRVVLAGVEFQGGFAQYSGLCTAAGVICPFLAHLILGKLRLLPYLGLAPLPAGSATRHSD